MDSLYGKIHLSMDDDWGYRDFRETPIFGCWKNRATPSHHPLIDGFSHGNKSSSYWGPILGSSIWLLKHRISWQLSSMFWFSKCHWPFMPLNGFPHRTIYGGNSSLGIVHRSPDGKLSSWPCLICETFSGGYPLVMTNIAMGNGSFIDGLPGFIY